MFNGQISIQGIRQARRRYDLFDFYLVGRRFDPDRAHFGIVKVLIKGSVRFVLSSLQTPTQSVGVNRGSDGLLCNTKPVMQGTKQNGI